MTERNVAPAIVTLERGAIQLTVSTKGAAVLRLEKANVPILRAARAGAPADPTASAMFPMVPWCNLVAAGSIAGKTSRTVLAPNWPTTPYPVHGFGWLDLWDVESQSASAVRLVHSRYEPEGHRYSAAFDIELTTDGAEFRLACTNMGPVDLPFGIGLHPYLPRDHVSVLTVPGGHPDHLRSARVA